MSVLHFTDSNFDAEVLGSKIPVLVDFWAEWCGPCRMMTPIIEQVAKEVDGKAKVGKLNVDEAPMIASRYNIMSIPTLIIFKDGKVVSQTVGGTAKEQLIQRINSVA